MAESSADRFGDDFGAEQMWGLRELPYPDPVPFVPQTVGWLLVSVVLVLVGAWLVWRARQRWLRNAYRRDALASIDSMQTDPERARQLPGVLRASALCAYPRGDVASLRGGAWVRWLNDTAGTELFGDEAAGQLDQLAYAPDLPAQSDIDMLLAAGRGWVMRHRV